MCCERRRNYRNNLGQFGGTTVLQCGVAISSPSVGCAADFKFSLLGVVISHISSVETWNVMFQDMDVKENVPCMIQN